MAQGAAFAQMPFMDRFDVDITSAIFTGDKIEIVPAQGIVRILSRIKAKD